MHQLFVYGTLRKGGVSHYLLKGAPLLKQNVWLKGYTLYSGGWFPVAMPAPGQQILGDVVEVSAIAWPELDAYEGDEYERIYAADQGFWLYCFMGNPKGLTPIPSGDWLHWRAENG